LPDVSTGNPSFDLFTISEDHEAVREAVRAVVEGKIAPYAAAVDEEARYPQEAHDALVASDFFAPHIPEEYGGVGADALATCIVIEEVARADASASLIPAVNKLGTLPLLLAASDKVKQKYLPPLAAGTSMFSYGLSEREAGSDVAGLTCRARADGDDFVLNGQKSWITNAGVSDFYTVMAVTDPDGPRGNNITAFVVEKSDPGFGFGEKERKLGIKGSPTRELHFDHCRIRRPHLLRRGSQVSCLRRGDEGHHRRGPAARRCRLHPRLPARADDARRQDHPDLRGHQPGPARGHGSPAPQALGPHAHSGMPGGRRGGDHPAYHSAVDVTRSITRFGPILAE
jgi:alkylation response protein AidB-like acyl-CoA dehydrogenase